MKCNKIWAIIIIVIALILAILATVWPQDRLTDIIYVTRFFDVMLPVLAFGALVKYLVKCGACSCGSCSKGSCSKGSCSKCGGKCDGGVCNSCGGKCETN